MSRETREEPWICGSGSADSLRHDFEGQPGTTSHFTSPRGPWVSPEQEDWAWRAISQEEEKRSLRMAYSSSTSRMCFLVLLGLSGISGRPAPNVEDRRKRFPASIRNLFKGLQGKKNCQLSCESHEINPIWQAGFLHIWKWIHDTKLFIPCLTFPLACIFHQGVSRLGSYSPEDAWYTTGAQYIVDPWQTICGLSPVLREWYEQNFSLSAYQGPAFKCFSIRVALTHFCGPQFALVEQPVKAPTKRGLTRTLVNGPAPSDSPDVKGWPRAGAELEGQNL